MSISIIYAEEKYFKSFHSALDKVAKEKVYIEMIEAFPLQQIIDFQKSLITNYWPNYYAIETDEVVGWADIHISSNPRLSHRGYLGMGVLKSHRKKGLGTALLNAVLEHAQKIGLEKVELNVYPDNLGAIALYKKFGFLETGCIKHYRKLEGHYFDCLLMEKFF